MPAIIPMHPLKILISLCMAAVICSGNRYSATGNTSGSFEAVKQAREKALFFLKSIQRTDGAICDTVNPLFETWETIMAVSAIYKHHPDTNNRVIRKGLTFLTNYEGKDGLLCHNRKCKEQYCLETTAVYFNLLLLIGQQEKVITGVKKIAALQKPTGEWDIGNPDVMFQKDFASVTAFVLNLLHKAGVEPVNKKKAVNWLLKKQAPEGDWGASWEYYGCRGYAFWPVLKLLHHENTTETRLAADKAISYIISTQNNDGSWFYTDSLSPKQVSAELQTALMLASLQEAGMKNHRAVLKGIIFLVNSQQKKGNWNGGFFPIPEKKYNKEEYVFATALVADVLHNQLTDNSH